MFLVPLPPLDTALERLALVGVALAASLLFATQVRVGIRRPRRPAPAWMTRLLSGIGLAVAISSPAVAKGRPSPTTLAGDTSRPWSAAGGVPPSPPSPVAASGSSSPVPQDANSDGEGPGASPIAAASDPDVPFDGTTVGNAAFGHARRAESPFRGSRHYPHRQMAAAVSSSAPSVDADRAGDAPVPGTTRAVSLGVAGAGAPAVHPAIHAARPPHVAHVTPLFPRERKHESARRRAFANTAPFEERRTPRLHVPTSASGGGAVPRVNTAIPIAGTAAALGKVRNLEKEACMRRHPAGTACNSGSRAPRRLHSVRKGDTLWGIASDVLGTNDIRRIARYWPKIHRANRATLGPNPNLLHVGQSLVLPNEHD